MIKRFESEFTEFFYNDLTGIISQNDEALPLLDFPETLFEALRSQSTLVVDDISVITLNHFKFKQSQSYSSNTITWKLLCQKISIFCKEFQAAYSNYLKTTNREEDTNSSTEPNSDTEEGLIFPVGANFLTFYRNYHSIVDDSRTKTDTRRKEKWNMVSSTFQEIIDLGPGFLKKCRRKGLINLFGDFSRFTKSLKDSILESVENIETMNPDGPLFFMCQSFECYFTGRYRYLITIENGVLSWDEFIKPFSNEIENILMKLIDKFEAMDKEPQEERAKPPGNWEEMSERLLKCQNVFSEFGDQFGNFEGSSVAISASTILNRLKRQFMDKHSANIPFNVDEMISIMAKNLQYYFDHYIGIKDLCPVLQEFKNKLFNIFHDFTPKSDSLKKLDFEIPNLYEHEITKRQDFSKRSVLQYPGRENTFTQMQSKARQITNEIIEKFFAATDLLQRRWFEVQVFEGDCIASQMFSSEVRLFCYEIKLSARARSIYQMSPKDLVLYLDSLIHTGVYSIRAPEIYLEIFSGFVTEIYREEFFSKLDLDSVSETGEVMATAKEPVQLPENLLDNPSEFINSASGNTDKAEALIGAYSKFIETEFSSLKNQNVKEIISASIRKALK